MSLPLPIHGRGASFNPANRFDKIDVVPDPDAEIDWANEPRPATQFLRDHSRSIVQRQDSPDVGMEASINPYRGCEHGCIYCFARPGHEYFGLSSGLDFETKIFAKFDAPDLLRKELARPSWKGESIMMSGVTDCYQPVEAKLGITRKCLEVFAEHRQAVGIVTKSRLVLRDLDVLQELNKHRAVHVAVSVTSLDNK